MVIAGGGAMGWMVQQVYESEGQAARLGAW